MGILVIRHLLVSSRLKGWDAASSRDSVLASTKSSTDSGGGLSPAGLLTS